jgi:hypothetical protein
MHTFEKTHDYPGKPCKLFTSDIISSYDGRLMEILEQSKRMEQMVRATNPVIYFHSGR